MRKTKPKDNQRALIVKKVAEKHGVTPAYVYMILSGERDNEEIFADYMELKENIKAVLENALLNEVKNLVPFN